jgi:tRNA-(ms[2]io[6]A)-hydroxylase
VTPAECSEIEALPLHSRTPIEWGMAVLADPISLLIDHAFLEKKAATNAMELLTRWPDDWLDGWVEAMTAVARDEANHLAQVTRFLLHRGGRLDRFHKNPYANALRLLVRKGEPSELLDRLLVAALIEVRSCERFSVLSAASADAELAGFYHALFSSELGHYRVFLNLARKFTKEVELDARWQEMLAAEACILAKQEPGPRIHSGLSQMVTPGCYEAGCTFSIFSSLGVERSNKIPSMRTGTLRGTGGESIASSKTNLSRPAMRNRLPPSSSTWPRTPI